MSENNHPSTGTRRGITSPAMPPLAYHPRRTDPHSPDYETALTLAGPSCLGTPLNTLYHSFANPRHPHHESAHQETHGLKACLTGAFSRLFEDHRLPNPPHGESNDGDEFEKCGPSESQPTHRNLILQALDISHTDPQTGRTCCATADLPEEDSVPFPMPETHDHGQFRKCQYPSRNGITRKVLKFESVLHRVQPLARRTIVKNLDTVDAQQYFILILAKGLLVCGSPSHRIESQLASVAALFRLTAQFVHTSNCIQVSFESPEYDVYETVLIKAATSTNLSKIADLHTIYRAVCKDEISATEGRKRLQHLLKSPATYSQKVNSLIYFAQGFLLCGTSFGGSPNDMWVAGVLSIFAQLLQRLAAKSLLSSIANDIFTVATVSAITRLLSTAFHQPLFCYRAITSAVVTMFLPATLMLAGVLDMSTRNIGLGAPKVISGVFTSLCIGFGLTLGSDALLYIDKYCLQGFLSTAPVPLIFNGTFFTANSTDPSFDAQKLSGTYMFFKTSGPTGYVMENGCRRSMSQPWPLQRLPWYSYFILIPLLNIVRSMKLSQPLFSRQMVVMVVISCISFGMTRLSNGPLKLSGRPDIVSFIGATIVSLLGNAYSHCFGGTAYTAMLTGIWLLVPNGLAEAGGLSSTASQPGEDEYTSSLELAVKMLSVIIGVMSGVYLGAQVVNLCGRKKTGSFFTF